MNWDAIGAIGEVVGAFAVVATLFYLAIQIRHSARTGEGNAMLSVIESHRASLRLSIAEPQLNDLLAQGVNNYEGLNESDRRRFSVFILDFCMQAQSTMELYKRNMIPKEDYDVWISFVCSILRTPGGASLWQEVQHYFTPSIRRVLNERIEQDRDQPDFRGNVSYLQKGSLDESTGE